MSAEPPPAPPVLPALLDPAVRSVLLVRLRTGAGGSYGQITTVAERAMALAREVDAVVYAADEVRRI